MLDPEVEARPWDEQVALDDAAYRAQLGYLLERSAFYRRKLGAAGVDAAHDAGGLAEIGQLPLTEKHELRETVTPDDPIGAHRCAARDGDRPDLLDERHDGDAELRPADGRRPRELDRRLRAQLCRLGRDGG